MQFFESVADGVSGGVSWVADEAEDAWDAGSDVVEDVVEDVADVAEDAYDSGSDLVDDVVQVSGDVVDGAAELGGTVASGVLDNADTVMPSPLGLLLDSGRSRQEIGDVMETVGNMVGPLAGPIGEGLLHTPGLGEILGGMQFGYHMGAGVYDAVTGDRDGAITHGAQGSANVLGMVPGLSEMMGAADMGLGSFGGAAKLGFGVDAPQSIGDVLANVAVENTNAVFGKDDTNWFASGSTPQGTRRGEIGAGLFALGPFAGPLIAAGNIRNYFKGEDSSMNPGQGAGDLVGDVFGTPRGAKTLGAGPASGAQKRGREVHDLWTGLFD